MLRKNKDGVYIIDSLEKLKEWWEMTKDTDPSDKTKVKVPTKKPKDKKK
jgi:hypothetical protein